MDPVTAPFFAFLLGLGIGYTLGFWRSY